MQNTQSYIQEESSKHLSEYYFILLKHKWIIIAACLIAVSLSIYRNSGLIPMYQTTATIVIEGDRKTSPITGQIMNYENFYLGSLAFNTHLKLIMSRPVLERVIKNLKTQSDRQERLDKKETPKNPSFTPSNKTSIYCWEKKQSLLLWSIKCLNRLQD